ncbi:MAG: Ppx/GppA family phosphatase [Verrucomicrobia bacterium]|nr:Ppx/GppA family phosphatase [Verrucomicrobiota bacterium]
MTNGSEPTGTSEIRALIDIGTNSVKLLVALVQGGQVDPIYEESEQTRLGRGFYETHVLQADAIQDTILALLRFREIAASLGARSVRTFATSAARDAVNQIDLLKAAQEKAGLRIEVISGEQEADWVYRGVRSDPLFLGGRLLILDVGGGSTEFILGESEHQQFCRSFPLGSVRLMEQVPHSDPPLSSELSRCRDHICNLLHSQVRPTLEAAFAQSTTPPSLVGTGGASSIMGRMLLRLESFERERMEGTVVSRSDASELVARLWSLPLHERRKLVGLPKKRADVILTGSLIYECVMEVLGFDSMRISTRGLRFGGIQQ